MSKTKFEYFHNHGDEDGNNSLTICFGDSDETDHIIVTCEDTEEDAIEAVNRLNKILDEYAAQCVAEYKEKLKKRLTDLSVDKHGRMFATEISELIDRISP